MRVIWTKEALERLQDVKHYLEVQQYSPAAANDQILRILARESQIGEMPLSGRVVPDYKHPKIRELMENPYRIIYRITDKVVYVVSVVHQRQLLPEAKALEESANTAIHEEEGK